jgi:hypothetical protein
VEMLRHNQDVVVEQCQVGVEVLLALGREAG